MLGPWEANPRLALCSRRDFGKLTLGFLVAVPFGDPVEQWSKEGKYTLNWTRLSCKE
jgi:hypothetical protein